jgi:hypothetical protein
MKKFNSRLVVCFVLLILIIPAQANHLPDVPEIEGVVTRAKSGQKLAGVEIVFEGMRGGRAVRISSATSRDDGAYYLRDEAFLDFADESITVTVTLDGYQKWRKVVTLDRSPLVINIELTPATN